MHQTDALAKFSFYFLYGTRARAHVEIKEEVNLPKGQSMGIKKLSSAIHFIWTAQGAQKSNQ